MKKIIYIMLAICLFSFGEIKPIFAEGDSYVKALFSSVVVFSEADVTSTIVLEVRYGTKLKLLSNEKVVGEDSYNYYLVEAIIEEYTKGYVLCSQVLSTEYSSPQKELVTNAEISKEATVYKYNNSSYVDTGVKLNAGEKVRIIDGYNTAKEYTKIQYKDADGDTLTAYVKTENLKTSGISRTTIGAIIIIVTTISLVLILFGVKGKKKKV